MKTHSVIDEKYDRQVRLFGEETQNKLKKMKIAIYGSRNLISAEILKNIVLLGVNTIIVSNSIVEETKRLVFDNLCEINEDLNIIESSDEKIDYTFVIEDQLINIPEIDNTCFICSRCISFYFKKVDHGMCCKVSVKEEHKFVYECMLGGMVVQEFVKRVQGLTNSIDSFNLENLLIN
ncbi:hypothetical protein HERIO_2428 [Hepatospora eriocheir]|uniref:Uncharacterized protein n=1 Tax=Hepatospora eriocheir TaxID=1081669 RepID=A0A1X0Q6Z5_9MICR|nr:hypothetical protein HERIO_2428 [Hepatospora eriocheir]